VSRKRLASLVLSLLLTVGLLGWIFQHIDLPSVLRALARVPAGHIALGFLCHAAAYLLRARAMHLFFASRGLGLAEVWANHLVHNFYVHVVPAGLGELSMSLLLKHKVPVASSLSVLLVTRVAILLASFGLFAVSVFAVVGPRAGAEWDFRLWVPLVLGMVLLAWASWRARGLVAGLLERFGPGRALLGKARKFLGAFRDELARLRVPGAPWRLMGATLASVLLVALYFVSILRGLGIETNVFETLFVSALGMAFMILPIKSVGGFGTIEGTWIVGLMILGLEKTLAIEAAFAVHLFALANVLVLFFIGLAVKRIFYRQNASA